MEADILRIKKGTNFAKQLFVRAMFVAKEMPMRPLRWGKHVISRWQKLFVDLVHTHVEEDTTAVVEALSKLYVSTSAGCQSKQLVLNISDFLVREFATHCVTTIQNGRLFESSPLTTWTSKLKAQLERRGEGHLGNVKSVKSG
jgi:hypothetical protein